MPNVVPTDSMIMLFRRILAGEKLHMTVLMSRCPKCEFHLATHCSAWWEGSNKAVRGDMVNRAIDAGFVDLDGDDICFVTELGEGWAKKLTFKERKERGMVGPPGRPRKQLETVQ